MCRPTHVLNRLHMLDLCHVAVINVYTEGVKAVVTGSSTKTSLVLLHWVIYPVLNTAARPDPSGTVADVTPLFGPNSLQ